MLMVLLKGAKQIIKYCRYVTVVYEGRFPFVNKCCKIIAGKSGAKILGSHFELF
jgi:hypothetical protein